MEDSMVRPFKRTVPMRTIVIFSYHPQVTNIPAAVAAAMPGEVYPGEIGWDVRGFGVSSTATIFPVIVAPGRTTDALSSIAASRLLFSVENVVVVHHTASNSFNREETVTAADYRSWLKRDTRLIRESHLTPQTANVYGYLFDVDTGRLTLVVESRACPEPAACSA
jgi:carbonic anhydrase